MLEPLKFTVQAIRARLNAAEQQELGLLAQDAGIVGQSLLFQELSLSVNNERISRAANSREQQQSASEIVGL